MKEYYDKYKGKIEIVSYDFCHLFPSHYFCDVEQYNAAAHSSWYI